MYVCMYVCMYVRMYVCMYVYVYMYICIYVVIYQFLSDFTILEGLKSLKLGPKNYGRKSEIGVKKTHVFLKFDSFVFSP